MKREQKKISVTEEKNIFDIENINDLPNDCKKEVERKRRAFTEKTRLILKLFSLKPILNTSEVIVAMYRLNNISLKRAEACNTLNNLVTRGVLQSPSKGVYKNVLELPEKYKNEIKDL